MAGPPRRFTILVLGILALVTAAGGIAAWSRYGQSQPLVWADVATPPRSGSVYIQGAVAVPGIYPLRPGDTLDSLIKSAGGAASGADSSRITVYVPLAAEADQPQKVDLNRAEAWLLEALPGIGAIRARAILDYRARNGGFHSVSELLKVEGIDSGTYERIKSLVTVGEQGSR